MNAKQHFQKGLDKITQNDFDKAVDYLTKAIDAESNNPFYFNHRAIAYMNLNKYDLAMFDMNRSIELDPAYAYFYSCRGFLKARLRDAEGAIADYEQSLQLDPENEITYNNLGLVLEQMGNAKRAKKMFDKGNEILGYDPKQRDLSEVKSTEQTEETTEEPDIPLDKKTANKERKKLAREVMSSKAAFKEFLGFIGNGFKLKENDKKGKS